MASRRLTARAIAVAALALGAAACGGDVSARQAPVRWSTVAAHAAVTSSQASAQRLPTPDSRLPTPDPQGANLVEVPAPPFTEGVFPCTDCHTAPDLPPNRTRRVLVDAHDDIVLKHDEQHRWCLDCHDANDRDQLHLASGDLVPFAQSYTLCGQCHGEKTRDWRAGVHGRRTGSWNGRKEYLLCVHCHDPHAPRFKSIAPEPAPLRLSPTTR